MITSSHQYCSACLSDKVIVEMGNAGPVLKCSLCGGYSIARHKSDRISMASLIGSAFICIGERIICGPRDPLNKSNRRRTF